MLMPAFRLWGCSADTRSSFFGNGDPPRLFRDVLEVNPHNWPICAQAELLRPLHNDNGMLGEDVLQTERFEIVGIADAVKIHVIHERPALVFVDERKSGARDFVNLGSAETACDALGQRRLPCPQIS